MPQLRGLEKILILSKKNLVKMRKLYKIQSISDVVTNSSSELFIMYQDDAEHIDKLVTQNGGYCDFLCPVTMEYILEHALDDDLWEMVCDLIGKDYSEAGAVYMESSAGWSWSWWENPDEECWQIFVEENKDAIQKQIVDKNYWAIEFEDHFADADEVNDVARDMCVIERNHH